MEKAAIKSRGPRKDSGFWSRQMESHKTSELSIKAYCLSQGLSEASFYKWRKRLEEGTGMGNELFSPISLGSKFMGSVALELPGGIVLRFASLPPVDYLRSLSSMFSGA